MNRYASRHTTCLSNLSKLKLRIFHGKFFFNFELESNRQTNSAVAVRYGRSGIPRPWINVSCRGVRKRLFKRLFAFKIGKIDLNIKRLNGILFKTVRLLCLKGPECLTRLESLKQNRFKQIMHHDV